MTNFDFQGMDEIRDVESKNIYSILSSIPLPEALRWRIIKASSRDNARTPMQWTKGKGSGLACMLTLLYKNGKIIKE